MLRMRLAKWRECLICGFEYFFNNDETMYKNYTILALIPARGGSQGVSKKNIRLLAGKPLIAHSIIIARASRYIDRVVVSTDSEEIADVARHYGAEVPFVRPSELAESFTPDAPVLAHCLKWLREHEQYEPHLIVHLRPTGPLRTKEEIDRAIELLADDPDADSIRSVEEPPKSPFKMWVRDGVYLKPFVVMEGVKDAHTAPRQTLPHVFQTTADIGICRTRVVLDYGSVIGHRVLPYVLERPTIDIDTLFDFELAEFLLRRRDPISWPTHEIADSSEQ